MRGTHRKRSSSRGLGCFALPKRPSLIPCPHLTQGEFRQWRFIDARNAQKTKLVTRTRLLRPPKAAFSHPLPTFNPRRVPPMAVHRCAERTENEARHADSAASPSQSGPHTSPCPLTLPGGHVLFPRKKHPVVFQQRSAYKPDITIRLFYLP